MMLLHALKFSPRLVALAVVLMSALLWAPYQGAQAATGESAVATAVIAVGDVQQIRGGVSKKLGLGEKLQEGDRIVTGRDGIAIIVFVDQARVSLRADTELVIGSYRLAQQGRPAEMRLELVRGAMRQISGDAMRSEPERYRLNTPVAAIGVRGTDFLAKASNETLETFIQEGSIVLMPLGNGCAAALDSRACAPIDLLAASDLMRYVRLSNTGELQRRGVSAGELEQLFGIKVARGSNAVPSSMLVALAPPPAEVSAPTTAPVVAAAPVATVVVSAAPVSAPGATTTAMPDPVQSSAQETKVSALVKAADVIASAPPTDSPTDSPTDPPTAPEPQPEPPPTPPSAPEPPAPPPVVIPEPPPAPLPMPTQLVWGRYATAASIPVTPVMTLPVSYAQASEGRHVTVGEPFEYALWREGARGSIDKGLRGLVSYSFVAGEAYFQAAGEKSGSQASIDSAKLSIDFDQSRFESAFKVSHAATGQVSIAATGRMNDEGIFTGGNNLERIAGAISKDGTEAGTLFTKSIEAGTVRGISLFRRP